MRIAVPGKGYALCGCWKFANYLALELGISFHFQGFFTHPTATKSSLGTLGQVF